jgi:drug/metabolite transporter, DME family
LTQNGSTTSSPPTRHRARGFFFIAGAALGWAVSASLGKAVFTGRMTLAGHAVGYLPPLILAQSRTTISLLILLPILLALAGPAKLRMPLADVGRCLLVGVLGLAASNYFYYLAIQMTTVAAAIILQYTAPIWVVIYMVGRRQHRLTASVVGAIGLAIVGIAFCVGFFSGNTLKIDKLGFLVAQTAALSFAFYNVYGRELVSRYSRWNVVLYALLGAAVFWVFVNPPWKIVRAHYDGAQWAYMLLFAVVSMLLPFSLYFSGLRHLDPTRAIVTSCLEPVFTILIAALTLGERVGGLQIVGVVAVLAATLLVQVPEHKPDIAASP